jgi:hypothetical protein
MIMGHAQDTRSSAIGLLLDQEKVYDHVHPDYLTQVLTKFGFPSTIVHSLSTLFFGTALRLNVNGFLSSGAPQKRGLHQGDPISPMLFNLAFEPLLRSLLHDQSIHGITLPRSSLLFPADANLQPIKLLAYAGDVVCLLRDPADMSRLQHHLFTYSAASNAKINYHKIVAISLSGARLYSSVWCPHLLANHITQWHDCSPSVPLIYLDFPMYTSTSQRDAFLEGLLQRIAQGCRVHSQRSLSVRARVTVLNNLILSKLWHVLRLTSVPIHFLTKIKSLIFSFLIYRLFPKISIETMCLPRKSSGWESWALQCSKGPYNYAVFSLFYMIRRLGHCLSSGVLP